MLIVGDRGYIGSNLKNKIVPADTYNRGCSESLLEEAVERNSVVVHLAATQRGTEKDFEANRMLTDRILECLVRGRTGPKKLIFASSIHALGKSPFGISKLAEEKSIAQRIGSNSFTILRIPHTFGRFARPFHNNVFATFAACVWNDLEVRVHSPIRVYECVDVTKVVDVIAEECVEAESRIVTIRPDVSIRLVDMLADMVRVSNGDHPREMDSNMTEAFLWYRNLQL